MSNQDEEFLAEVREHAKRLAELFENKESAVVGASLGDAVARYVTGYPPASQPTIFAAMIAMILKTIARLAQGEDDLFPAKPREFTVEVSEVASEVLDEHPEAREYVAETIARVKNALADLTAGKFSSVEEAMASISGMEKVEEEEADELSSFMSEKPKGVRH
jgi:hypothetical protein